MLKSKEFFASQIIPLWLFFIELDAPPIFEHTGTVPLAIASKTTLPNVSVVEGKTNKSLEA